MNKFSKYIITSLSITTLSIGMLYVFTDIVHIWYMYSAIMTSGILAIVGFAINYLWVWKNKRKDAKIVITSKFIKYIIVGGCVTLMSWLILFILTSFIGIWYIASTAVCWIIGTTATFLANNLWTYST